MAGQPQQQGGAAPAQQQQQGQTPAQPVFRDWAAI